MAKIFKEVADVLATATRKAEARSFGQDVPDDTVVRARSGDLVIKAMPNEDLKLLNESLKTNAGISKGLDLGRIGEIFGEDSFNEIMFKTGDEAFNLERVLTNIKENNKEVFAYLRRDTKSMDELMQMAHATGYEPIIVRFLNRKPGQVQPPEDVLAGIVGMIKLGQELEALAVQGTKAKTDALKEDIFKRMRFIATVQSNLAAQVSGNVSEYGRGLAVVRNISKLDLDVADYAAQMDRFVNEMDDGVIDYHFHQMLTLRSPAAKAKYAEKGFAAKTYDFAMEQYVNALLSSPTTHMVNIAGNATFQIQTALERGLAGMIGNVRTLGGRVGEVGDQRYMGEALAEAHGLMMAQKDAFLLMSKTMITGESSDLVSKIDLQSRRSFGSTDNLADIASGFAQGDFSKAAIDTLGVATRLPGRFLASEDEYFKVITQRRVLYRESYRASQMAYQNARRAGASREDAKAIAEQAYVRMFSEPDETIVKMMKDEARQMTFQNAPEGFFGDTARTISSIPGARFIVPFVNTPTNIVQQAFDRTLNFSPIYRYIKQNAPGGKLLPGGNKPISGVEFDDALAKLAVGNTVAMTMYGLASGYYGDDIIVTGRLGKEFATRQGVSRSANVPPYSIGVKQEDGSYRFKSFSRFDPMSAMLVMGADMAEYARYEDDPSMFMLMTKAYTLSAAEYATNMPFLQGFSELTSAIAGRGTTEEFFERMGKFAGEQAGNVGTNVIGNVDRATFGLGSYAANTLTDGKYPLVGQTSFGATLERLNDPMASSTKLPAGYTPDILGGDYITESPMILQGFYSALQKAKARNPYFSADLKPNRDWWGRPLTQGEGRLDETFNPVRVQSGQYTPLDLEIIRLSETGIGVVTTRHSDRVDGVRLNADQYDRFVQIINTVDGDGRMPGDFGYNATDNLLGALNGLVDATTETGADYSTMDDDDRYDEMSKTVANRRKSARALLKKEFPNLEFRTTSFE
jgi:hypothetical protein